MNFNNLYLKLKRAGYEPDRKKIYSITGRVVDSIWIYHDYSGPYPSKAALDIYEAVTNIARRAGYYSEGRGCKQATCIYNETYQAHFERHKEEAAF